jgi:hypothetical protein
MAIRQKKIKGKRDKKHSKGFDLRFFLAFFYCIAAIDNIYNQTFCYREIYLLFKRGIGITTLTAICTIHLNSC